MFGRLFSRNPIPVPALCLEAEQEFGEMYGANMLMQDIDVCLKLMYEKRFQSRVLFPHFGIPAPKTLLATEFQHEFYPLFLKDDFRTQYIGSAEEISNQDLEFHGRPRIVQEYIKPTTSVPSHLRLVVESRHQVDEDRIKGVAILYNTTKGEHMSNHRRGGKGIALTGKGALEDISDFEMQILADLRIDPHNREIPAEILRCVYELRSCDGKRLYDYLGWAGFRVGIDAVFGCPFSYDHSGHGESMPKWYFLEVQPGPSTKLLEEIGALLPEKVT